MKEYELKDVLHLYLGAEVQTPTRRYPIGGGKAFKAIGRMMDYDLVINQVGVHFPYEDPCNLEQYPIDQVKPILREFSSMTDEDVRELIHYDKIKNQYKHIEYHFDGTSIKIDYTIEADEGTHSQSFRIDRFAMNAYDIAWCLKKGLDMFNLIGRGLAIDQKMLNELI